MPDDSVDIRMVIGGATIGLDYVAPFAIKQTRGTDPFMFTVVVTDISGIPSPAGGNGVPVTFKYSTPGTSGRVDKEWKGLYLLRVEQSKAMPGLWNLVFADERWLMQFKRFTMSYNIQWPDGSYRADTVPNGSQRPWEARAAILDAFQKMGYTLDISELPVLTGVTLPNNLGNSPAGGWVEATFEEIAGPMLAALEADLIWRTRGQFAAVPRTGDGPKDSARGLSGKLASLRAFSRISDTVGIPMNKYERPRKIRVAFEIKAEAALESSVDLPATSSQSVSPIFDAPENVMPRFTASDKELDAWWDSQSAPLPDTDWDLISSQLFLQDYLPRIGGGANTSPVHIDEFIGENYFLPEIIPFKRSYSEGPIEESSDPSDNVTEVLKKLWFDNMLRHCWRSIYRVVFPSPSTPHPLVKDARRMSNLRFGRLTPGGESYSRGSVFMDWCEELATVVNLGTSLDPFDSVFSYNHYFAEDRTRPAPFDVKWIAQSGNELIFQVSPTQSRYLAQNKIFPGTLDSPIRHREYLSSILGLEAVDVTRAKFDPDHNFRIIMSGRLIAEDERLKPAGLSTEATINGRYAVIEGATSFTDGNIESIDFKVVNETANYAYSKRQLDRPIGQLCIEFPEVLLNITTMKETFERVKQNVERDYKLGNSGGILIAGVESIDQVETGGDIYEMSVVVGDPDPWSVVTQYYFLPGVRSWSVDKEMRDGRTPNLIEQE